MMFESQFEPFDDLEPESPTSSFPRNQIPVRRVKSARNYTHRRRERYSLRVPKTAYTTRDYTYPRSLESIDDWSLYRPNGPTSPLPGPSSSNMGLNATSNNTPTTTPSSMCGEPRGARRVQSFRCTSKGGVVKMGDFFLGNASPDNYVAKEETSNHHHHTHHHHSSQYHPSPSSYPNEPSSTGLPGASSPFTSYMPRGSPTCSRKSSNSCDSLRSSKTFHVFVAGFKSVGKHRVMNACLGNSVNEKLKATILIDYEQFNINFKVIDKFEDSEEISENNTPPTVQGKRNQALLIIYSIADRKSFEKAGQILTLAILRHCHSNPKLAICLIANKSDLVRARVVTTEEGYDLAARFNVHFIETSAEIGDNIEQIMVWIVEKIKENLSVVNNGPTSGAKTTSTKGKSKVITRARTCIRQIFKHFVFKTRSAENLSANNT